MYKTNHNQLKENSTTESPPNQQFSRAQFTVMNGQICNVKELIVGKTFFHSIALRLNSCFSSLITTTEQLMRV